MDLVGDTCQAFRAYFERAGAADREDKGAGYLLAYGVLQALFLQQDSVFWWCKCLGIKPAANFDNPGEWAATMPALADARTARNDSIGHPVRRDRPKSSPVAAFFLVQHSLSWDGFELHGHDERGGFDRRYVSFVTLIGDQVHVLADVLKAACVSLDEDDKEHHRKFMLKPLTPILNRLDYPLEKLGAVRTGTDAVLLPALADDVEKALTELQAAIQERQEPFGENWQWEYRKIRRALQVLRDYAKQDDGNRDDDLADVAGDFVRYAIDDLQEMTEELDERYSR